MYCLCLPRFVFLLAIGGTALLLQLVTPSESAQMAPPVGKLTWSDEFNAKAGTGPDPRKWVYDIGSAFGNGWGNMELEYYTNSTDNSAHDGRGNLVITARDVRGANAQYAGCFYGACNYTSARLTTAHKFSQKYGRFEARIKIPSGQGMWPAFWMLGDGNLNGVAWPKCGEIDIMESVGKTPSTLYGSLHGPALTDISNVTVGAPLANDFHVYTVDWSASQIAWYIDGVRFKLSRADAANSTQWVFNNSPFYLLLNLAVGGTWPGSPDASTPFPARMLVDYVRVYSLLK